MTRRHLTFRCHGAQLVGTLDPGNSTSGLLLLSGGNEIRAGAFSGQAQIAARIAAAGYPVFRFDRRGTGDSEGKNGEFRSSGPDIAAALAEFRMQCSDLSRIVGFGNCDAASALMLAGGGGMDALVLSNPWTFGDDSEEDEVPPEVVRDHYRKRLNDPAALRRLITGQVSILKLVRSLRDALRPSAQRGSLTREMAAEISQFGGGVRFLIAGRDRTGLAFLANWDKADQRVRICPNATHAYVEPDAREWLTAQILEVLAGRT